MTWHCSCTGFTRDSRAAQLIYYGAFVMIVIPAAAFIESAKFETVATNERGGALTVRMDARR
jgi:hypothetical protein